MVMEAAESMKNSESDQIFYDNPELKNFRSMLHDTDLKKDLLEEVFRRNFPKVAGWFMHTHSAKYTDHYPLVKVPYSRVSSHKCGCYNISMKYF